MRIPIAAAAFCQDCSCFGDNLIECECGSKALLTMSTVMNRQEDPFTDIPACTEEEIKRFFEVPK